jgi:hypothetical protein
MRENVNSKFDSTYFTAVSSIILLRRDNSISSCRVRSFCNAYICASFFKVLSINTVVFIFWEGDLISVSLGWSSL